MVLVLLLLFLLLFLLLLPVGFISGRAADHHRRPSHRFAVLVYHDCIGSVSAFRASLAESPGRNSKWIVANTSIVLVVALISFSHSAETTTSSTFPHD